MQNRPLLVVVLCASLVSIGVSQTRPIIRVAIHDPAQDIKDKSDSWFSTDEGIARIDKIISYQLPNGGWEKGYGDPQAKAPGQEPNEWFGRGTIDNDFTYTELRALARAYNLTKRQNVLDAFDRGLDFLFTAQYPNGGWPQRYPLPDNYGRDITFNDDAMISVMKLMQDVTKDPQFAFVDSARRARAKDAFDRALDCTLKCQVVINGELTVWPQQCDAVTLKPTKARSFELESITGGESTGIVLLLMSLDHPSPQVQHAIRSAVAWYERSKVLGKRIEKKPDPTLPHGNDVYLVDDPNAPPLWGRFYDLETNQVFFCGRDSVKKSSLDQIEAERRAGYVWLGPYGKAVLEQYRAWSAKYGTSDVSSK